MTAPISHRMNFQENTRFDSLVESVAGALDVPEGAYEQATQRYEAVGRWLSAEGSPLRESRPVIYPQGSFALGTVIRPLRNAGADYDIDAVVELEGPIREWTPADLKRLVGDRLRAHADYNRMLGAEGRRCWTLEYAAASGAPGFHMDLLPSLRAAGDAVSRTADPASPTAIAITNRTPFQRYEWRPSDPKGYAGWFRGRMVVRLDGRGVPLSERRAHIEAVPTYRVRTPLQQTVCILKRHRDVMFVHDREHAPISVILTTLAAHAYGGEASLGQAFVGIVSRMAQHVERSGGQVRIPNPVRPEENFADRWEGDARKEVAFEQWLDEVKVLGDRLRDLSDHELEGELAGMLGESVARDSVRRFAERADGRTPALLVEHKGSVSVPPSQKEFPVLALASAAHRRTPPWPDRATRYRARVRGAVVGGQGARRGPIESGRSRVLPGARLEFRVETDAPPGAVYFWQVVNTGDDARLDGGLRGDFDVGETTRTERAMYRGMHSIECFIVHRGECVGRSGQFFVRIGSDLA